MNAWAVTFVAAADPARARQLTRRISWGGLLTALILFFLIIKFYAPTADLAFLALTSLGVAIAVIETDVRTALAVYAAASLLSLAYPGLAAAWPFIILFGPYPLIRAGVDSNFARLPAFLVRLLAGNGLAILAAGLFVRSDLQSLAGQYGSWIWPALFVCLQAAIVIFDQALSLLIQFYITRLRRR